ncbi:hypothetical protein DFH09DRAFT_1418468 [Mycena vulgaris]|nr:hypothetical protein DFH09DRAFT_1418468 [Mycena vulgaris]
MADSFQCRARLHHIPDPQDQTSGPCDAQREFFSIPLQSVQFDGRCRRRAALFKPMPLSTPNSRFIVHPQLVGPSAAPPIRMPRPRESLTTTNPPQMKFLGKADPSKTDRAPLARSRSLHPRFPPPSRPERSALASARTSSRSARLPFFCYGPVWIPPGADFQRCFTKLSAGSPAPHRRTRTVFWDSPRSCPPPSAMTPCRPNRCGGLPRARARRICDWYRVRDLYARRIPNLPTHVSIRRARAMLRTSTSDSARLASDKPIPPLYPVRCAYAVREEQWRTGVLAFKVTRGGATWSARWYWFCGHKTRVCGLGMGSLRRRRSPRPNAHTAA